MKKIFFKKSLLFFGNIFLIFFSLYLSLFLRWQKLVLPRVFLFFLKQFFPLFLLWFFLIFIFDFYSIETQNSGIFIFLRYFFIFLFIAIFSGVFYFYFSPYVSITPKAILFLNILIFFTLFIVWHFFINWIFGKRAKKEKIIFWGDFPEKKFLINFIKKNKPQYQIISSFKEDAGIKDVINLIKKKNVNLVILSPEVKNFEKLFFSFPELEIEGYAEFYEKITQRFPLSALKDPNVLNQFLQADDKIYLFLKRAFDVFWGIIGFLFFVLTFLPIAFFVKTTSKGPIFFIQPRMGKDKKVFPSLKYRSMYHLERQRQDDIWREKNKNEITLVGRFLRFTHLDELPQFINILKGEISIIGPRPEWEKIAKIYEKEIPFYYLRYKVKPGFTGWAQINYPPSTSIEEAKEKFEYDLYYIKNKSFIFDFLIFLKSLRKIFG